MRTLVFPLAAVLVLGVGALPHAVLAQGGEIVVRSAVELRAKDLLEIAARHTHALVQRQRARERGNRVVVHSPTVVENAEVVLCSRIRRIYAAGEIAEYLRIPR